jgi:hypothetical protein
MNSNIVYLAPPIITQQDPQAGHNKLLRQAFREGRAASLFEPDKKCPYKDELAQQWQKGYDDGAGQAEKIAAAEESGRKAALLAPNTPCPYEEFVPSQDKFRLAWLAGFEAGAKRAAMIDRKELAWSRGWHAGCYQPIARSPYSEVDPLNDEWWRGRRAGAIAAVMVGDFSHHDSRPATALAEEPDLESEVDIEPSDDELAEEALLAVKPKPGRKRRRAAPVRSAVPSGKPGRTAKDVTDLAEMERIWKAYKKNGGTMTFDEIELVPEFKLRFAKGMTAYRIVNNYAATLALA